MHGRLTDEPLPGDGRLLFAGTLEQRSVVLVVMLVGGLWGCGSARGIAEPPGSTAVDTSAGSM
ncbi:MAG TPA: hypothetical protein VFU54_14585 [Actinomycetota bacterium]|jgi:hypothetical protein|nr:hypothetical protein [Actinomycetota bacterium]